MLERERERERERDKKGYSILTFSLSSSNRKNHQRAMDSMQASLEAEVRAKQEALRIKKKLESDINELEIALDHANKANSEAHKSIKRYQAQLRDVEQAYEEEARQRQVKTKIVSNFHSKTLRSLGLDWSLQRYSRFLP